MKVLLVAMADSVHTARWISQLEDSEIEFTLFPSTPNRRLHPVVKTLLRRADGKLLRLRSADRYLAFPLGLIDLLLGNRLRSRRLAALLRSEHFDAIHLLETQHAGYLFTATSKHAVPDIPVILSLWGSDLNWFGNIEGHKEKISGILYLVDLLLVECERDIELARKFGFAGSVSEPIPASGGIGSRRELAERTPLPLPSTRRGIVIKGYTGFVGKADVAARVVGRLRCELANNEIHFYSVSLLMFVRLQLVRLRTSLNIHVHRKKTLRHGEVLAMFGSARVSLSLSLSDGLPGSVREAAWMGAFPIESRGSCVCEWTRCDAGVLIVDPLDEDEVAAALLRALRDDSLVDDALDVNQDFVHRLANEDVRALSLDQYRRAMTL